MKSACIPIWILAGFLVLSSCDLSSTVQLGSSDPVQPPPIPRPGCSDTTGLIRIFDGLNEDYPCGRPISLDTAAGHLAVSGFDFEFLGEDSSRIPDSGWMEVGGDSIPVAITAYRSSKPFGPTRLEAHASFGREFKVEGADLHLFRHSIEFGVVEMSVEEDSLSVPKWSEFYPEWNTVSRILLQRLYASTAPRTISSLDSIYGVQLVSGGGYGVYGFPATAPKGFVLDDVRNAALQQVVAMHRPLQEIVRSWVLDLDFPTAKARILALVPAISSSDSAALFP